MGQNKHQQRITTESNRYKSDEIVMLAGDFGPKSCASIHYTMWISLILRTTENIKKYKNFMQL